MQIELSSVNLLAVLLAALAMFVLGGLWYSPALFAKRWMAENTFTEERLRGGNQAKIFGTSFILALIAAFAVEIVLGSGSSAARGAIAGLLIGAGWVATSFGITYVFERKTLTLFLINAGYHVAAFTAIGAITGAL